MTESTLTCAIMLFNYTPLYIGVSCLAYLLGVNA